ncbi:OmpP1/FadL family transporter [Imhoffiella purpurea]|uniref:Long-chain fatty acid transport protein n=1 Tax=Imhoffiella purpurea TaxID=1249627 RepID=W9VWD2_9GAMM|nr:OmpP1/FadL family transporter [Imhoffiella purpurea]EXJ14755.1 Long-chain fatty acid transport protein [Imhoffiella purpurea]
MRTRTLLMLGVSVAVTAVVVAPACAWGSGFAVTEYDAAGLGRAFAGTAVVIAASSLSTNPAALPDRATLSASLHGLHNDIQPESAGVDALIPAAYGAWHGLGVGVYAPFGLATDYPSDWSGRYSALHSEIQSARVQVAGGIEVQPGLRLGAGVFVQRFRAELSQAYPVIPGRLDAEVTVDGEDTGLGWTVGGLWAPDPGLTLGLAFASAVDHQLRGHADLPSGRASTRVDLTTPETLSLGLSWQVRPAWRVLGGLAWTRWSRFESLEIRLSNGLELSEEHQWRDTWRASLGAEHERGPWTLRAGLAWDQSPIRHDAHRYPRLPDADRIWTTLGLGYAWPHWRLDLGYAHLWFPERSGEHPAVSYSGSTDILALGVTRTW